MFRYPTRADTSEGYNLPHVKMEFGSHTGTKPNGIYTIISWVAEEFPDVFESPEFKIVSLYAERTFWEKVTILHAEYHRDKTSPMRMRLSRDLYDLYCMAEHELGKKALSNFDLLKEVVEHKQLYFFSARAKYEEVKPGTLCLVPPDFRLSELESDYKKMKEMFTEDPPNFNELISKIKEIENHINKS
ncbi:MAG: nucleotidyl transferase AbiEii/AbiGii toxin family protein [Candidatus Aminicenantes bacterium]|nr:nucleotidyl transferase AbiEii/AbiGii toxin family protein [Candidatus Aminicenantes bacterium]